jgi:hypothetical protein
MATNIPAVPPGATILASAVVEAFNRAATHVPLNVAEVMVGLGSATIVILTETAAQSGRPLPKLLEDYKASLKLSLPPEETKS